MSVISRKLSSVHWLHSVVVICLYSIGFTLFADHAMASKISNHDQSALYIGKFSDGDTNGWSLKSFDGKTIYQPVNDPAASTSQKVLKSVSDDSASGLFREQRIDLEKTPWIHWSWKTLQLFSNIDEQQKSGDDFVARLYVVIDGGIFFWNTIALNYVWSSSHNTGESWKSPYTSNSTLLAVESGDSRLGQWQHYKRNVREDLKRLTGKDVHYIDAVAIMTDSDNSGQQAVTYYGDIYFTPE